MKVGAGVGSMRRRADLVAYVPVAAVTTIAAVRGHERAHLVSKMLLAPTLAGGVVATRAGRPWQRTATLAVALTGSGVGDWFMNRSDRAETDAGRRALVRRGASAFAVQQAGLIAVLLGDGARPRRAPAAAAGTVLAGLGALDAVGTGGPDPVLTAYGLLLGAMSALAMGEGAGPRRRRAAALGGGLFLLSDATIIVGDHLATTPRRRAVASAVILSTYTAALALLVHGLRDEPEPAPAAISGLTAEALA